jgi:2-isopropylmalate synthase
VLKDAWPVARLELEHPVRGRVTDIGKAPGAFDAAFVAAGHIVGVSPQLLSYNVQSGPSVAGEALPIRIDVEIELDGRRYEGSSSGVDLVRCSVEAWLDAIAKRQA